MPFTGGVPDSSLEKRCVRRFLFGCRQWPVLPWLLLGAYASVVCRRRDEPVVDRGVDPLCAARKSGAVRCARWTPVGSRPVCHGCVEFGSRSLLKSGVSVT